jgi:hypothetical protein
MSQPAIKVITGGGKNKRILQALTRNKILDFKKIDQT